VALPKPAAGEAGALTLFSNHQESPVSFAERESTPTSAAVEVFETLFKKGVLSIQVERITPTKAEKWLNEHNNCNRALREGRVEMLTEDMKNGDWTFCVAPIVFYDDGDIADGQHRLWAIVNSGVAQDMIVVRGLPRAAGLNIDTQLPRTLVDAGRISEKDTHLSNTIIAIARAVENGMASARDTLSFAQKLLLVAEHREAAEWANGHVPHRRYIANSVVFAAVARAWYHEKDLDRLNEFCKVLGNGYSKGDADSAAITMRNYLLDNANNTATSAMWRDTFLKVQNAISYFMKRRRLTVIKGVKEEAYPLKKRRKAAK
jgi:hypothetical protein